MRRRYVRRRHEVMCGFPFDVFMGAAVWGVGVVSEGGVGWRSWAMLWFEGALRRWSSSTVGLSFCVICGCDDGRMAVYIVCAGYMPYGYVSARGERDTRGRGIADLGGGVAAGERGLIVRTVCGRGAHIVESYDLCHVVRCATVATTLEQSFFLGWRVPAAAGAPVYRETTQRQVSKPKSALWGHTFMRSPSRATPRGAPSRPI